MNTSQEKHCIVLTVNNSVSKKALNVIGFFAVGSGTYQTEISTVSIAWDTRFGDFKYLGDHLIASEVEKMTNDIMKV